MRSTFGSNEWAARFMSRHLVEPWNYAARASAKSLYTAAKFSLSTDLATGLHLQQRNQARLLEKKES
jgi:hypothetical protein